MALVVVGCTGETPEPSPEPTASATVEPSPTPTPTPTSEVPQEPEQPDSWWETDEAAAVDAAEYFFELYDYTTRSGDLETWNQISGQTCDFCINVAEGVEAEFADGGQLQGGALRVADVKAVAYDASIDVYGVQAKFDHEAATRVDSDGVVTAEYERATGYIVLDVAASVRGWVLMEGSIQDGPVE